MVASIITACVKADPGNAQVCVQCATHFILSDDQTFCILPAESRFIHGVLGVLGFLVALIIISCLAKTIQQVVERVKEFYEETKAVNSIDELTQHLLSTEALRLTWEKEKEGSVDEVIECAALNWRYKLMKDWSRASQRLQRYSLWVDINQKNIIGVGLPHFYNFHILPLTLSILSMLVIEISEIGTGFRAAVEDEQLSDADLSSAARKYVENLWFWLGFLYAFMLLFSWIHAIAQIYFVQHFDRSNSMMNDFAVELNQLPANMTSENKLWNLAKETFKSSGADPIGVSIGYDLTGTVGHEIWELSECMVVHRDVEYLDKSDRLIKRYGTEKASFGYPTTLAQQDHVKDDYMERRFRYTEGALRGSGHAWVVFRTKLEAERVASMFDGFWLKDTVEYHRAEHNEWMKALNPGGALYDDFTELWEDQVAVLQYDITLGGKMLRNGTLVKLPCPRGLYSEELMFEGGPNHLLPDGAMIQIERRVIVRRCSDEPPTMMWYALGTRKKKIIKNTLSSILITMTVFLIILLLVYLPYSTFILTPYAEVDAFPGQVTSQTSGFLIGLANNILGAVMGMKAWGVGFSNKSSLDLWVLSFNIIVTIFNTVFNLIFAFYHALLEMYAYRVDLTLFGASCKAEYRESLMKELNMSTLLYNLMWPGWLFSGFLTGQLTGIVVPWIQNWILLQVVFKCKCLPTWLNKVLALIIPWQPDSERALTIRGAEKVFCPPEISLAWDYADKIVTPSVCLLTLFFLSPDMWKIFPRLVQWVAFMYLFHRYVHLQLCKKQLHVDSELGDLAMYLWNLPLGIIAAAWVYWTCRLGYARSYILVPIAFFASVWVYSMGLKIILMSAKKGARKEKDKYYSYVEKFLLYNWFNCNPVHVLKSCYGELRGVEYAAEVPFVFGKEYLVIGTYSDEDENGLGKRQESLQNLKKKFGGKSRIYHFFFSTMTKGTPLLSLAVLIVSQFVYNVVH